MSCGKITASIALDCNKPLISGVDAENLILINRNDILTVAKDPLNPLIVTGITLQAGGVQAYSFEGINNSVRPSGESIADGYYPYKFMHSVEFRVFDRGAAAKNQVRNIVAADLVAIYFRKGQTIEIMGMDAGLNNNTVTFNEYEEDSAYLLTLATDTDNGDFEPFLPYTYTDGVKTFDVLKAEILALLTPTAP